MGFQLFPEEEYWLKSPYTVGESISMLASNVMERDFMTLGLLGSVLDRKMKIYRYFEGRINDLDFKISHKQYWHARTSGYVNSTPSINGVISQAQSGSVVRVNCSASNWIYLSTVLRLGIFIILISTHAPLMVYVIFMLLYIFSLFIQRYLYMRRMRKDKEELKRIFNAHEEGGALF